MKHCPQCGHEYSDDHSFCVDDGATLYLLSGSSLNSPTQIMSSPAITRSDRAGSRSSTLFVFVGGMVTAIIALGVAAYLLTRERPASAIEPRAKTVATETNAAATVPDETRMIAKADALSLLDRWKAAQNTKDFAAYAALYSPSFVGYKDTPTGPVRRQSYREWLADRRGMVRNFIGVEVIDERVAVDREQTVISFTQRWRSMRMCDVGTKEITLRMFADGPKIVSEILRNSQRCN